MNATDLTEDCTNKSHLKSIHRLAQAWVRAASSAQAWVVVHREDPQRLESIRIPARLIPINALPTEDCTLEAMRTQASPDLCAGLILCGA
jgi:hypothetical protein